MNILSSIPRFLQWFTFLILTFFVSLAFSWVVLAKLDFAYPWLYTHANIGDHIAHYAPLNPMKPNFDQTSPEERAQLFHGMVEAIHHQGQGLTSLVYHNSNGQPLNTLLTEAEVLHLQDVANLLDKASLVAWVALILWLCLFAILLYYRRALPSIRHLALGVLGLGAAIAVVMLLGAERVFYQLHVWAFPEGHQWFFYYEESLMSMMMKAPDIFGYIAIMLVTLALIITICLLWGYRVAVLYRKG